jgi:hypothetical protein
LTRQALFACEQEKNSYNLLDWQVDKTVIVDCDILKTSVAMIWKFQNGWASWCRQGNEINWNPYIENVGGHNCLSLTIQPPIYFRYDYFKKKSSEVVFG